MVTFVFHDKSFETLIVAPHNSTISLVKHVDRGSLSIPRHSAPCTVYRRGLLSTGRTGVTLFVPKILYRAMFAMSKLWIQRVSLRPMLVLRFQLFTFQIWTSWISSHMYSVITENIFWKFSSLWVVVVVIVMREYRLFILNCNLYWNTYKVHRSLSLSL